MTARDGGARRQELGHFLRTMRARIEPAGAGLPAPRRSRTPGLRREDVAQLAGFSATWYTWIEQGRDISVSPSALVRLAAALRLDRAERAYLFELAGKHDPDAAAPLPDAPGPAIQACLDALACPPLACPAYALDRAWTMTAWNAPAARLFTGWLDVPGDRNLLRFIFLAPAARQLIDAWAERARRVVAEFRAQAGPHQHDAAIAGLIAALADASPDFARLWAEPAVHQREGGMRSFHHPRDGTLRFEQLALTLAARPGVKLTVLVPMTHLTEQPAA